MFVASTFMTFFQLHVCYDEGICNVTKIHLPISQTTSMIGDDEGVFARTILMTGFSYIGS